MDKRTLLAVVLSVLVMTAGYLIQNRLAPPTPVVEEESTAVEEVVSTPVDVQETVEKEPTTFTFVDENIPERKITVETEKFIVVFNNKGASVESLILQEHVDYNTGLPIDMVNSKGTLETAFNISFEENFEDYLNSTFHYEDKGNGKHEFYRDFLDKNDNSFRIVKTYTFLDNEYLFKIDIDVINAPYRSYSLSFGPDIGPTFTKLDNRNEFRKYYTYADGDRENHKLKDNVELITNQVTWASINGKYFSLSIIPENRTSSVTFENNKLNEIKESSFVHVSNSITSNNTSDSFYIYAGPKDSNVLDMYDVAEKNGFGLSDLSLSENIDSTTIPGLGWLSNILKYALIFFNKLIPNYGIAIILLTIVIKAVFYPITHKSFESTSKMQAIQPKLKKLQEQYKNDPQKLNMATAELYKTEGVNPLGGCLPMLVQMPIFFALYGLLNSYFGLRGASFIPGWIDNLAMPESVYTLPFSIPLLGWTAIRVLPVLYLGTQLVMSRITQAGSAASGAQSNSQMKMLTLGMPIMFFFILYDMPSGLLVYWTVTNLLSAAQQYVINKKRASKES